MRRYIFMATLSILFVSCAANRSTNSDGTVGNYKHSKFSDFTELGITKDSLISKFGAPLSKDMSGNEDTLTEVLNYIEFMENNRIVVKTKFIFENGILKEQKTETETSNTYKKEIDALEIQLQAIRHQIMFK